MRERQIYWEPWADPGLEHLRLGLGRDEIVADGLVLRQPERGAPFRLWYQIRCDGACRIREAQVRAWGEGEAALELTVDGAGRWTGRDGRLPDLDGCIDLDITATPFTNPLPIRRLGLRPGETADLPVAWVIVPGLRVERARQRYTCLRLEAQGAVYLYENLDNGFRADLPVDADGIVHDYPGQFRRREPRRERG